MNDQDTNAETIDAGFHPASNCWVREVKLIFRECFCILRKGSLFLGNYDPGINYVLDDAEKQIGGPLEAGFVLTDLFEDYNEDGRLAECRVPSFVACQSSEAAEKRK